MRPLRTLDNKEQSPCSKEWTLLRESLDFLRQEITTELWKIHEFGGPELCCEQAKSSLTYVSGSALLSANKREWLVVSRLKGWPGSIFWWWRGILCTLRLRWGALWACLGASSRRTQKHILRTLIWIVTYNFWGKHLCIRLCILCLTPCTKSCSSGAVLEPMLCQENPRRKDKAVPEQHSIGYYCTELYAMAQTTVLSKMHAAPPSLHRELNDFT